MPFICWSRYAVYMLVPFLWIIAAVATGQLPLLALLCFVALIPAMKNFKQACTFDKLGIEAMKGLDQASAKLQMAFSVPLALGLFLSALF